MNYTGQKSYGKINYDHFVSTILPQLGSARSELVLGPAPGVDFSAIRIARNKTLLLSCDPISYLPELGAEDSAFISIASLTADLLTSGVEPAYAAFVLTLPPEMSNADFRKYWAAINRECQRLGIAIVAGHTGSYQGCNYSIIGSGFVMTTATAGRYVSSSMAKPGNKLIMTKTAGIETTFIFAKSFPETVRKEIGNKAFEEAVSLISRMSVFDDALSAVSVGMHAKGITSMHDVAEGGVIGAVVELAEASSVGVLVHEDKIPVAPVTRKVCDLFSLNPLTTLGEGSLLLTCPPSKERRVLNALRKSGVEATTIGKIVDKSEGRILVRNGSEERLGSVDSAEYWRAYAEAKSRGLT
ncbi:MAG: AIR synthase family protein [Conexivisphaerales archaeon]